MPRKIQNVRSSFGECHRIRPRISYGHSFDHGSKPEGVEACLLSTKEKYPFSEETPKFTEKKNAQQHLPFAVLTRATGARFIPPYTEQLNLIEVAPKTLLRNPESVHIHLSICHFCRIPKLLQGLGRSVRRSWSDFEPPRAPSPC